MKEKNIKETNDREIPYHRGPSRMSGGPGPGEGRQEMAELFTEFWLEIIQSAGDVFASSSQVLECLKGLGHLKHVTKANGVGDVLGVRHFKLPFATVKGKRLFLIPAIIWDSDTLKEFLALAAEEKIERSVSLEKVLLGIDFSSGDTPETTPVPESTYAPDIDEGAELEAAGMSDTD